MGVHRPIRIAVLTSSRADFGIYLPLLKAIRNDHAFTLELIVFGTHLSPYHGLTRTEIIREGFTIDYEIASLLITDDAASISSSFGLTSLKFSEFWKANGNSFDMVFCLGDRFEMAAAVLAAVPFNIRFAHLHGGETTLGAIDNIYRHAISLVASVHFVSAQPFADRVRELCGLHSKTIVTGSLSLDNLDDINELSPEEVHLKWNIDLFKRFVLVTIHPETVAFDKNRQYAAEAVSALETIASEQSVVLTMPNADTNGTIFREAFQSLAQKLPGRIFIVENFGVQGYFTCMKAAALLVGNTSSGIIEAASFGKYVVNIGDRQKDRLTSNNVVHVPFDSTAIVTAWKELSGKTYEGTNIYKLGSASTTIIQALKEYFNETV